MNPEPFSNSRQGLLPSANGLAKEGREVELLMSAINAGNNVFQNRHNWLSPMTSDEERKQFIARYCDWWNQIVCPVMDAIGAVWNERGRRFELPRQNKTEP